MKCADAQVSGRKADTTATSVRAVVARRGSDVMTYKRRVTIGSSAPRPALLGTFGFAKLARVLGLDPAGA